MTTLSETRMRTPPALAQSVKRLIDLTGGLALLILTAPLVALAALAVKLADPGPAFFVQERHGLHGRTFKLVKLRTMRRSADAWLVAWLAANPDAPDPRIHRGAADPRIIPKVGTLLRRYSIDELPQLWNVVRGDLSLVGPRPLPGYHVALLDPAFQALRSQVRPGITGSWQVESRDHADPSSLERCDRAYLARWSLMLDLAILWRTVGCVLRGSGI